MMAARDRSSGHSPEMPERDPVVRFVASVACDFPEIRTIRLFGSRARGEHDETSDYDLLIEAGNLEHRTWLRFIRAIDDGAPTLHKIDCVLASPNLDARLRAHAEQEGIIVYER